MDKQEDVNKIFLEAISQGSEDQVRSLIASHGFCHTADGGYSLLVEALKCGKFAIARVLITCCAKVNNAALPQEPHFSPLHLAVGSQQMDIAEGLLNRGADINAIGYFGITPIAKAIRDGNLEFLELLLNRGVDLNAKGPDGLRPLHIAAKEGREGAVLFLLSYGADIDASSTDNKTALYFAAEKCHSDIVKLLLQFQPDLNNEGNKNSLYAAIQRKTYAHDIDCRGLRVEILLTLLNYGLMYELEPACDPKFFHGAVEQGFLEIVDDLLKYGADANTVYCEETPLLIATKIRRADIAELLVSYGADVNAQDSEKKTPIHIVAESGNAKLFNILVTHGATISDYPHVVHAAIRGTSLEIVEQLLKLGNVDINDCTYDSTAALQASLLNGCGDITTLFLEKGADVHVRYEKIQDTPLHLACANRDYENCEVMLRKGAAVGSKNKKGRTALHEAGNVETVRILLDFGADINSQDRNGRTPLYTALKSGNPSVFRTLLKFGADVDSADLNGKTALHFACKSRYPIFVILLLNYGADINICDENNRTPLDFILSCMVRLKDLILIRDNFNFVIKHFQHFMYQIVRMEAIQMYVSEKNLEGIHESLDVLETSVEDFTGELRGLCQVEIGKLQVKKITNSNISYYEFLTKDTNSLAVLLLSDNIVKGFESDGDVTEEEFPSFDPLLKSQFRRAMERKGLVEQGSEMFGYLCAELPHLPACCVLEIFQYLNKKDLQMLNAACRTTSQRPTEDKLMPSCEGDSSYEEDSSDDSYGWWKGLCDSSEEDSSDG